MMIGRDDARRALSNYVETPVALLMGRVGLTPNLVTIIGLLIAGVAAYLIAVGLWWVGGLVALFAGIFDMFDGALARNTGRASDFGALLDSTIDRVSEAVVLLGVLAFYLASDNDWGAMLVYAALVGSIMVSYMRARSEGLGIECKVGVMQRPERVALTGLGLIVAHWIPVVMLVVLGVIAALTTVTAIHRLVHTWRMLGPDK
ncbi:MAG: CDP-alcohol phosphatidyltransferase family protein [Dehalococcoidia bacterium]|nr:CDP-alcohol phosphatidyltransferase family protein [Dehalococcoidia bacterium]MYA62135.1 CDP-alcohol phosphatidyltransferase family protein [Dehalococcoidia bacterium]